MAGGLNSLYASAANAEHKKPGSGHGDGRRIRRTIPVDKPNPKEGADTLKKGVSPEVQPFAHNKKGAASKAVKPKSTVNKKKVHPLYG